MQPSFHKQAGLSLVEVAITTLILGILAAVVMSRLLIITGSAQKAAVETVRAAFRAGVNGVHQQWLTEYQPEVLKSQDIDFGMTNTGWPETTSDKADGYATPKKCLEIWNAVLQNPPLASDSDCTGPCIYWVTTKVLDSGRIECAYIYHRGQERQTGDAILYDLSTGFIH